MHAQSVLRVLSAGMRVLVGLMPKMGSNVRKINVQGREKKKKKRVLELCRGGVGDLDWHSARTKEG